MVFSKNLEKRQAFILIKLNYFKNFRLPTLMMVLFDGVNSCVGSDIRSSLMDIAPWSIRRRASFFDGANFCSQMKLIKWRGVLSSILISGISFGIALFENTLIKFSLAFSAASCE